MGSPYPDRQYDSGSEGAGQAHDNRGRTALDPLAEPVLSLSKGRGDSGLVIFIRQGADGDRHGSTLENVSLGDASGLHSGIDPNDPLGAVHGQHHAVFEGGGAYLGAHHAGHAVLS